MSTSGNMSPQSRSMIRPSTSMQAQLRPISPSPPRKVTLTLAEGWLAIEARVHLSAPVLDANGCRRERGATPADLKAERAQHGLRGHREVRLPRGGERERPGHRCVPLAGPHDVA